MAKGQPISDEVRAQVIAAILAGDGVSEVARKLKLPHSTVSRIRSQINVDQLDEVGRNKQQSINDLICEYLAANFRAQRVMCEVLGNAEYLKKHSPNQIADAHNELSGKAFQLIEAESQEAADSEEGEE